MSIGSFLKSLFQRRPAGPLVRDLCEIAEALALSESYIRRLVERGAGRTYDDDPAIEGGRRDLATVRGALDKAKAQLAAARAADRDQAAAALANAANKSATTRLQKRPVAFRIPQGPGLFLILQNEEAARNVAEECGVEYHGLYARADAVDASRTK